MVSLLRLFGSAHLETPEAQITLTSERASWLIAYLGAREDWVSREEVLELFWPEADEPTARNNLRQLLHRIRKLGWGDGLEADASGVHWAFETDVRLFRRAFARADWAEAVRLHRGPFLDGLRVPGLPALEDWLESERDDLQAAWRDAALGHASDLERNGAAPDALPILEELLGFDPYSEGALVAFVRAAVQAGQHDRARGAFEAYRRRVREDLGLEPEPSTVQLVESLLEQTPEPPADRAIQAANNLSQRRTAFIGREEELALLASQLADASCRALTLVGPGGAGKTRLALQAAEAELRTFRDGVWFVPLASVGSSELIPAAIAEAVGLTLSGAKEPAAQVLDHLASREALIVLDNLEHLTDGAEFVLELIRAAPGVRLLITSRASLGLAEERVMPLDGLPYPATPDLDAMRRSSAVRLFVERAARLRAGFALTPEVAPGIHRVCALVEGLPLGLELAAAWVGALSPEAIAHGIEDCLDFLANDQPDRPERHRSLRAAFEHSWALLSIEEQQALSRLSVFRGGVERRGASAVAGVSPRTLVSLIGKSLLRSAPSGRFELLEVIRQHAAEKLEPEEASHVSAAHAAHFEALAAEARRNSDGPDQARWFSQLEGDHANIRAALAWALETDPAAGLRLSASLVQFWAIRGYALEGFQTVQALLERSSVSPIPDDVRTRALLSASTQAVSLGRLSEADAMLEEALGHARRLNDPSLEGNAQFLFGQVMRMRGMHEAATEHYESALALYRSAGDRYSEASALNDLGILAAYRNDTEHARQRFSQSLEIRRGLGDRKGEAFALNNLSVVAESPEAQRALIEQSLVIKRELGDVAGVGRSMGNLASLAIEAKDVAAAKPLVQESLQIFSQLGLESFLCIALSHAALVAGLEQDYPRALRLNGAALAMFERTGVGQDPVGVQARLSLEAAAADRLGASETQRLIEAGRAMSRSDAISYALLGRDAAQQVV